MNHFFTPVKRFSLAVTILVVMLAGYFGVIHARAATVCSPATAIASPFSKDGVGDFCWQATSLCTYINSWNLTTLEVNGTAYTNLYQAASSIAPLNGTYTIHYVSTVGWGHFEIGGTCSGGTTNTATPAASPTRTATSVISGPTATFTRTPTRTNTPVASPTRTNTPVATASGGTLDNLDSYNTGLFTKADGWTNGSPFNVGWRADHIAFANGIMTLTLDNSTCPSGCSNAPYASGEYRRNILTGYGLYQASFKSAKASGTVSSFFTYTGPSDGQPWDEIDIEILGKNTTQMQANYFTNGTGGHETIINLGFDSSTGFHTYGIEYRATYIKWYVDGNLVLTENGSRGALPSHNMKMMMNLWAGTGVDSWLGTFSYPGALHQQFDWVKYTP
jgi:endo-1,3-1,4-beta-glycanase ExoK